MHHNNWELFIKLCRQAKKKDCLDLLLHFLLTPEERAQVSARVSLIQALLQKTTQRDIAEQLGISISKITRGSNALKNIDPKLEEFLTEELT